MEMFEVLESVPAWKPSYTITQEAYNEATEAHRKHLARAFELFSSYWKTGNDILLDMSLEELAKAGRFIDAIVWAITDDKVIDKLSKRATFMYDLATCMMGAIGEN